MIKATQELYTKLSERYPAHAKIGRFLFSGGVSAGVDLILLFIFTDIFGWWYLVSAIFAFLIAFGVSFTLQKFWTFQDHSREGVHAQAGIYFFVAVINLALNTLFVYLFVEYIHLHYLLAQIVASLLIACESFFVYQRFIFRAPTV